MGRTATRRRRLLRSSLVLACVLTSGACHRAKTTTPPADDAVVRFEDLEYHEDPLPERTKIFLVAGGHDSANFAQEIVEQTRVWRDAGFDDDEIACYWAKPTPRAFVEDRAQYESLARALRGCYAARPALLRRHLALTATREPPFLYVYITSHGVRSVLREAEDSERGAVQDAIASANACERQMLDSHAMVLAGDRAGALHVPAILRKVRGGADPDDVVLTPAALRRTLSEYDPDTPKVIALQGCFSGGFIDSDGDARTIDGIADIPSLTVLTAARYDRSSFGCQSGNRQTEFGKAYNDVLDRTLGLRNPAWVPWQAVYRRTRRRVVRREKDTYEGRSMPGYYRSERHIRANPDVDARTCELD